MTDDEIRAAARAAAAKLPPLSERQKNILRALLNPAGRKAA